ncbi:MAG: C1 family peptidase [Pseudomonadota bacterium]
MKKTVLKRTLFAAAAAICVLLLANSLAFAKELDDINKAIKEKKAKWVAGETSVSRLPYSERKLRAAAHKPHLKDTDTFITPEPPLAGIPVGIDWRNYNGLNYVTPVKDQGGCGSCWAFASTAALESYFLIQENLPGQNEDFAEQVLVSCSGAGSCGGGTISAASSYIRDTGLPPEMDYYYTGTDGSCANAVPGWQQAAYRIGSWSYACVSPNVDAIKNALVTYGPVATMFAVYSDFLSYKSGVYSYTTGSYLGNHCVLIMGYDDLNQCFVAKNSWGTGWGEAGFFKIAYSQCSNGVNFGFYSIAYTPQVACSYGISPSSQAFNDAGGAATITVTARADCSWNAVSNNSWITIDQVTASLGNGTVYYSVAPNPTPGTVRNGSITVAGQSFAVSQGTASDSTNTTKKVPPGQAKKVR